jgi:hypothetical protein
MFMTHTRPKFDMLGSKGSSSQQQTGNYTKFSHSNHVITLQPPKNLDTASSTSYSAHESMRTKIPYYAVLHVTATNCGEQTVALCRILTV